MHRGHQAHPDCGLEPDSDREPNPARAWRELFAELTNQIDPVAA